MNTKIQTADVTLQNIKGDEDSAKDILVNGKRVGVVSRGWLRLGGNQWVIQMTNRAAVGCSTLTEVKRSVARRLNREASA